MFRFECAPALLLAPLFLLSSSSLRPPSGKITHRISLPPVLQCISQIHLELGYLPGYTRRDPVMKQGREEGEEEGRGERKAGIEEGGRGGREGRGEREEGRVDGRRKGAQSLFLDAPFHLFFACLDHRRYPTTLLSMLGYCGPAVALTKLWVLS